MPRGFSTWIILSSAGARFNAPPQTRQPLILETILFILLISKLTLHNTSIVSAVPAGLVIDLLDVFGIVNPAAAIIGTKIIDVLFPGIPPMQCLSTIGYLFTRKTSP